MQELGNLLSKVKGAGQVSLSQPSQRSNIQQESDMVLRPLMDLLDGRSVLCHGDDPHGNNDEDDDADDNRHGDDHHGD
jgi:hypothetical protein